MSIKSIWEFCLPLVSEKNDEGVFKRASLGRVAFWVVFSMAIYVWMFTTGDIQPAHLQMLYITTTYNLMKKASWFGNFKSGDSSMSINQTKPEDKEPAPNIRRY